MLCDLLLFNLAKAALTASVAAEGIQGKGGQQMVAELLIEVTIGRMRLKDFFGFGTALVDEVLHLPAVLALARRL